MKGLLAIGMSIALALAAVVHADARKRLLGKSLDEGRAKALPPILFEIEKQDETLASRFKVQPTNRPTALLPERIYLVYNPTFKKWYYSLTDFEGHLPDPPEYVRWKSVFAGRYLGAKKPQQHYINIEKLTWTPSFRPELHDWFVASDPPFIKVEELLRVVKVKP